MANSEIQTVSHWLVFLCLLTIFTSGAFAGYLIVRFERPPQENEEEEEEQLHEEDGWKPSLRCIHPVCLLVIRFISFSLLLVLIIYYAIVNGGKVFNYYPIWTMVLNIVYFLIGFVLSVYGCKKHFRDAHFIGPRERPKVAGFWTFILQIIFQMQAGAIVFTLTIFWAIEIRDLVRKESIMDPLKACVHSVNLVLVLIETAFNNLKTFPWFRISYFVLLTWTFTLYQWTILFGPERLWWPYFFLDMASPYSPLWYLAVPLYEVPCYGVFVLLVNLK
ncbi:uncharacterized protein [Rutidosis leptorrhynchoides]|uniref:uncharacterized protein n=1 Tax=Rutidosis leptorrhynchoides TaxID=125765 RepID=UPI003A99C130